MRFQDRVGKWVGLCALSLLTAATGPARAGSIGLSRTTAANVPLMVLNVNLNDPGVKVTGMVAPNGRAERFDSMVRRTHPTAAITGTYFCEQSLIPVGDIVVEGKLVHRGCVGTGFCLTDDNRCEFIKPMRRGRTDWSPFDYVCCAGPRLLCADQVVVNPRPEGFHDRHLLGRASRLAVGVTADNHLIFAATRRPVSLTRLAMAMHRLGCTDAINLDAGSSLGFYKGGKFLAQPHRKLTNLILIYDDRSRYARFKHRLSPNLTQTAHR